MGFNHCMESKVLALSVLILLIASAVSVGCALLPFWFRLHFGPEDATYGSQEPREEELQIGIFYIFKPNKPGPERTKVLMTSLLAMDQASNIPVVPPLFKVGQIFYTIGVFGTAVGMGGACILALRQFGSLTGNFGLAIFTILAGIFQALGIVFVVLTALDSGAEWHMMPLENPFRFVITSHPTMILDWGFYIAIIGAALAIVGAVLLIIEALKVCKSVEGIRVQQRKTKPPQDPYPDIRYTRFDYADVPRPKPDFSTYSHGHSTPGMVLSQGHPTGHATGMVLRGPPQQQFIAQPQPSPQPPRYGDYPPEPSPQPSLEHIEYKEPPKGYVSRQVDL